MNNFHTYHLYYWADPEKVVRRCHFIEAVDDMAAAVRAANFLDGIGVSTDSATLFRVVPVVI